MTRAFLFGLLCLLACEKNKTPKAASSNPPPAANTSATPGGTTQLSPIASGSTSPVPAPQPQSPAPVVPLGAPAKILLGNTEAWRAKLALVESAKSSVDAAYFIYQDDYTSSAFSEALIAKAKQGVKVRLIVDATTNISYQEYFRMMVAKGAPNLKIVLFRYQSNKFDLEQLQKSWYSVALGFSKRIHHKLLLVDKERIILGGRNIDDGYHLESFDPLFKEPISFFDADIELSSKAIAESAQKTFDAYWDCGSNSKCVASVPSLLLPTETLNPFSTLFAKLTERASVVRAAKPPSTAALHQGILEIANLNAEYVENRMFPGRTSPPPLASLTEEESQYHKLWVKLINEVPAGQDIVIHNAYVFFTPTLLRPLQAALARGVKVKIVTNSKVSTDMPFVPKFGGAQYLAFLEWAKAKSFPLEMYEYRTKEMLHSKVSLMGDKMIIGACNADARSEYLDSQNGVVIYPSQTKWNGKTYASAADAYRDWLWSHSTIWRATTPESLKQDRLEFLKKSLTSIDPVDVALISGELDRLNRLAMGTDAAADKAWKQLLEWFIHL